MLLHLNNLENLTEAATERAADGLRGIRDQALLLDGLHLIVVGATDAVATVVQRHRQIRSVFRPPVVLDPLALSTAMAGARHGCRGGTVRDWYATVPKPTKPLVFKKSLQGFGTLLHKRLRPPKRHGALSSAAWPRHWPPSLGRTGATTTCGDRLLATVSANSSPTT